ncbi:MAG: C25 family cysteine peptidase [Pyrinomonadaceae bacterium]
MKKATSFALLLGLIFSTVSVSFGQRSKRIDVRPARTQKTAVPNLANSGTRTEFQRVEAILPRSGVYIRWQMKVESANMGFQVYRNANGSREPINSKIILGSAASSGRYLIYGADYAYFDQKGSPGDVYEIEAIDLDGISTYSSAISAVSGKVPDVNGRRIPGTEDPNQSLESSRVISSSLRPPKEVVAEFESRSLVEDQTVHRWVLSRPGVRIDAKKEGIYRVPFADLLAAGFDTSSNTDNWQLYLRGIQQAIIVNTGSQYIEFYGKGIDTVETDIQGYFLVTGDAAGKRMNNYVARPSNNPAVLQSYDQTFSFRERTLYINSILNGDPGNYFGRGINSAGVNINFNLTGIDLNSPTAEFYLKIQGFSTGIHSVRAILNGQMIGTIGGIAQFPSETTIPVPTSLLKDAGLGQGQNVLNLASVGPTGDFNLFDTVEVRFNRKYLASTNTLKAYTLNSRKSRLRGFASANVRVFDISRDGETEVITNLPFGPIDGAFGVDFPAGRPKAIFAADDSALLTPQAIVAHDAELLAVNTHQADLIIIAYRTLLPEANAWAAYRNSQGIVTEVVSVDEIFNEFNYGSLSSDSIEAFLNYANSNWQNLPQYALLIGDASYDSRNYENLGFFNYVPTRLVNTVFSETGSDESLADFNEDGLAEMAIGRIPARQGSSVTNALAKVMDWEANLSDPLSRGTIFAFDEPNGYDFQGMSNRMRNELPAGTPADMVFRFQPNAQADLIAAMNTGKYLINYSGHGSVSSWASTGFFWSDNVNSLTNANKSIYTALTCLNGYYLALDRNSLAETLLDSSVGGGVAVWASTGLTTPDVQEIMGRRFYNKIGQGNIPLMGDLIRDAKTVINGGTDVRLSWTLIGDPMLKVR